MVTVSVLVAIYVGWLVGGPTWAELRRARIRRRPFPQAWRDTLKRRVPLFRSLPADLQLQLKKHVQVFIAEKTFIGCQGVVIDDEIRVTVAAQACLLQLNRRADYYPNLQQILIYPSAFVVDRTHTDSMGVQHAQKRALLGESWSQGQVILSWEDTHAASTASAPGHNLVIHEFAHQLDQENGAANGFPRLQRRSHAKRWTAVMTAEYERLRQAVFMQEPSLLDPYGATDPAEFFAVTSETFFEQPLRMANEHPDLFAVLARFYRINPLSW